MKKSTLPIVAVLVFSAAIIMPENSLGASGYIHNEKDGPVSGELMPIQKDAMLHINGLDYGKWTEAGYGTGQLTVSTTVNYKDTGDPTCHYGATLPTGCFTFYNGVPCRVDLPGGGVRTFYQGTPGTCTSEYYQW